MITGNSCRIPAGRKNRGAATRSTNFWLPADSYGLTAVSCRLPASNYGMISSMTERHYSNQELASIFQKIASLLEIKGELIYKILAYRKAADSLENLGMDASALCKMGKLTEIPGRGQSHRREDRRAVQTGSLEFLVKLEAEVPPTLVDLLQVPDLGPKKVALFWKQLGITDLAGLEAAARAGKLQSLPGMGAKSEQRIMAGHGGARAPH